ncbi:hypothetical protein [Ralstonia pseudosolanacearum]|uniref:hypothetical protein n=1 Tax=Ralstonia pseudosolanacearum TaxID=1310165 RepID=UPI0018D06A11|nr:hypothetical protein [Ralstonia pseudosolanacearum]
MTEGERTDLFQLLVSAPGTRNVEIIDVHPKGGYRVRVDLSADAIDDFIAYLEDRDWMSAM